MVRVTAIRIYWKAGPNAVFQQETFLGGLQSQYYRPVPEPEPEPTLPLPELRQPARKLPPMAPTLRDFIRWLVIHTHEEQVAIFGQSAVTYRTWLDWVTWQRSMGKEIL